MRQKTRGVGALRRARALGAVVRRGVVQERALEVVGVEPEVDERGCESFDPRAVHRFAVAFSLYRRQQPPGRLPHDLADVLFDNGNA